MDVSLVIPVLNRLNFIEKTMESIIGAGTVFKEIILVDNGSSDGTYEQLLSYPHRFSIPIIISQEIKCGASAARNRGLELATSKWVYFFDSDDEFTGFRIIFRTEFLRSVGGWNEECLIWDDWELGLRALTSSGKIQWLTERAYHRILIHQDSLTGDSFSANWTKLVKTLSVASQDINSISDDEIKRKCYLSLFYRICIIRGILLSEGNVAASDKMAEEFINIKPSVLIHSLAGIFLKWYTGIGAR